MLTFGVSASRFRHKIADPTPRSLCCGMGSEVSVRRDQNLEPCSYMDENLEPWDPSLEPWSHTHENFELWNQNHSYEELFKKH